MVSKEKPGVWLDLYTCANDNDPIPSEFGEGSGPHVDPRILEIARILGRQAAREFVEHAANDNEPQDIEPGNRDEPL